MLHAVKDPSIEFSFLTIYYLYYYFDYENDHVTLIYIYNDKYVLYSSYENFYVKGLNYGSNLLGRSKIIGYTVL